jgi:hypothetical protein
MHKRFLLAFLLLVLTTYGAIAQTRGYIYKAFTAKGKNDALIAVDSIRAAQLAQITSLLKAMPDSEKKPIVANADKQVGQAWEVLPFSVFNEFKQNGNRVNYENKYFDRRNRFTALLIGEITERKGRYLPEIVNGLGAILEESTWALPAHMNMFQKAGVGLPDNQDPVLDLFASQTANLLANARYLLINELNDYSPQLIKRIDYELNKRIFEPFLSRDDLSWMGFDGGKMNNWNTFINTNLLNTALLAQDDKARRNAIIDKTMRSIDFFLNDYPADGGCDEGPSYWGMAGGSLIQYLDLLSTFTNQRIDFSKNQLIHNIGSYIYKVHIDKRYYVNFADAAAISVPDALKVYLYGKMFNNKQLLQFAAYIRQTSASDHNLSDVSLFLGALAADAVLKSTTPKAPQVQQSWLPDLEVLTLRQTAGSPKGLFFAAKGGNNNESHNHNDIGNFIVYKDGMPVIIDAGVGTYTKQTFGKDRYKLWFMQSGWHNCPIINGVEQQNGQRFKATDVSYTATNSKQTLVMDIAAAYPAKAQVNSWLRTFSFVPAKGTLTLTEAYSLKQSLAAAQLNFLVYGTVVEEGRGSLKLTNPSGQAVVVTYDPAVFDYKVDPRPVDDARLANSWKSALNRVTLTIKNQELKGNHSLTFR